MIASFWCIKPLKTVISGLHGGKNKKIVGHGPFKQNKKNHNQKDK